MTTVRRPYIRPAYEQSVDDGCLEWKSIPMAVVRDVVKVQHAQNEYTGIKQIYNLIPPRPKNINAMATSIARINNLPNSAVEAISKKIIEEEVADVRRFAALAPASESDIEEDQHYEAEQPTRSTTGVRLEPVEIGASRGTQTYNYTKGQSTQTDYAIYPTKNKPKNISVMEGVISILGDLAPTSGVVPMETGIASQTEWVNHREAGFMPRSIEFAQGQATAFSFIGGMGYTKEGKVGHFREGFATQTEISKPPSGKNIPHGTLKGAERFFENPQDRFGTITGTPTRHLKREDKITRLVGEHFTATTGIGQSVGSSTIPTMTATPTSSGTSSGVQSPYRSNNP